jgi:membrane protein implicated in regulation of membrane protease activity
MKLNRRALSQRLTEGVMKKIPIVLLAGLLLGTALLWAESAKGDVYDRRKNLYNDKRQICHGVKGLGKGPAAVTLSPRPVDFTNPKFWQNNVDIKIANKIQNGRGSMPAFKPFQSDITDLILPLLGLVLFKFLPWREALPLYVVILIVSFGLFWKIMQAQRRRPVIGKKAMIGDLAVVVSVKGDEVKVDYWGETWRAVSPQPLHQGQQVIIKGMEGLTLRVAPLSFPPADDNR